MPRKSPTLVHLEQEQRDRLNQISKETGAPVGELIRRAVDAYLQQIKPLSKKGDAQ